MDDAIFSNSFYFVNYRYQKRHYRDNRSGADTHFFGWLKSGSARLVSDNRTIDIEAGDFFYIPKGCRYQSYWSSEDVVDLISLGFRSYPGEGRRRYCLQKINITPETARLLELLSSDIRVGCRSVGYLCLLMADCEERMEVESADRHGGIVDDAIRYMYGLDHISAEELARYCGVGLSTLYLAFRKSLGKTPVTVWHEIQVQKATELLVTTDLPVEQISSRLGFSSSSYFRKVFAAQTGISPREMRKRNLTMVENENRQT